MKVLYEAFDGTHHESRKACKIYEQQHLIPEDSFGGKIRKRRLDMNLTQDELASMVGISRVSFTNIESNRHFPSVGVLQNLVKVFNCTATDLLGF